METLIACKTAGKSTLIKPMGEVQSLLRRVFPDDSVDLYVMHMETGKVVTVTIHGTQVTLEKYI